MVLKRGTNTANIAPLPPKCTHFFKTMGEIQAAKGIGGLYAGVSVKCVHLGGSGAMLAVLVPRFKTMWGVK
jgi:solute carrier family 25 2-oxodicarboxylate transporter 21